MSWLSKAIGKSKSKGTGIYSWGNSPTVRAMVSHIPGAGPLLSAGLGALSKSSGKAQRTATSAKTGASWIHIS